ncbi:MAG: hypothetical protein COW85_14810 [Ignavibacteria bacterium CG22_combo_CG10-13_8_21_14_all_37_15]|nr:MAG: hypothetical protein COW85_14810 [Ignavibacteria bacterium CG22_combo_CG10-13_8_21_14_all_37_15]
MITFFSTDQNNFPFFFFLCFRFAWHMMYYSLPYQFVYKRTIKSTKYICIYSTHALNTFLSAVSQSPKFLMSKIPFQKFVINIINQEPIKILGG